jgi:hypothetical protein
MWRCGGGQALRSKQRHTPLTSGSCLCRIQQGNLRLMTARAGLDRLGTEPNIFDRLERAEIRCFSFAVIIILSGHRLSKKMVCAIPACIFKCSNLSVDLWSAHQPAQSKLNIAQTTNAKRTPSPRFGPDHYSGPVICHGNVLELRHAGRHFFATDRVTVTSRFSPAVFLPPPTSSVSTGANRVSYLVDDTICAYRHSSPFLYLPLLRLSLFYNNH